MAVSKTDLQELKRIATNTYDDEKIFMNRVIMGIGAYESEIRKLQAEIVLLKSQKQ